LVALGFLEQPLNGGRRYRLGPKAHDIGMLALNSRRQRRIARPHLQELRSRLSYTVSLGVLDDRDVLIMDRFGGYRGHARLKMNIGVGSRWPTYCTSMGKSLLAHLSKAELDEVIGGVALEKWTPTTIRSKHALRAELKQIAAAGFAIDDQELATGTRSIAVPVRSKTGRLAGALEVAAPATMIDRAQMTKRFFPALLETSAAIAAELPDEPRFKSKRQDHSSGS
jgi:IclR family pca regulon transcriptional regulator